MSSIAIVWDRAPASGAIEVVDGEIGEVSIETGRGTAGGGRFSFDDRGPGRLLVPIRRCNVGHGPGVTIVTVRTPTVPFSFSFFLRDVTGRHPIFLPDHGVLITDAADQRSYEQVAGEIRRRGFQTSRQRMEAEAETDYETAAAATRPTTCPTWLGLGRDIRIFELDFPRAYEGFVRPRLHNSPVRLRAWEDQPVQYSFALGRGVMCEHRNWRRLEDGVLPILHGTMLDEDIRYEVAAFVAPERGKLCAEGVQGTDARVAYMHGIGCIFTKEQQESLRDLANDEVDRDEQPVFFLRAEAINTGDVPRYAWIKSPIPSHAVEGWRGPPWTFDRSSGFSVLENGEVFCIMRLDGQPMPQPELGVLLAPGRSATFELRLPHRPIPQARALQLLARSFDDRHAECREFWIEKLADGGRVRLPERRIDEMIRAGLIHLDLVAYGREPGGPIAACTGKYTPIGTESAPIIQFLDSMGRHDLARRALMFFLDLQRADGAMDAFYGYLVETGAILWTIGEHFRYTRDEGWVRQILPKLKRSCDYLMAWRQRNRQEPLRGRGYGMIDGAVCDLPDPYRHFVLNGYACLGLSRLAEMLKAIDPAESAKLAGEAEAWKRDIRESLFEGMARSPVVPLGDGTWCPTAPPWAEGRGPVCLFADDTDWYGEQKRAFFNRTGAHFWVRDSMLGPHYLVFQEVLAHDEVAAGWLHEYHTDLLMKQNVASSQPYYSRHPWIHLKRGEVKAFLKAYYHCLAAQADRQTYSFPEGIIRSVSGIEKDSPHKTHEEGWFLMETRWMLFMEEGGTLRFLPGIPRAWLQDGGIIELERIATYFGPASLKVESSAAEGTIRASVECRSDRQPRCVEIRLPHPLRRLPVKVAGGTYCERTETVRIEPFADRAEVVLTY